MDSIERGQVTGSAADIYEEFFVPALFAQWAGPLCDAAEITTGDRVLDAACGTGIAAREASARVGAGGTVAGLDRNDGMLAVARRIAPRIDWRNGLVESMPFADGEFDAVISQFGLMFFEDRIAALSEMWRVTRPGGRLAVAVWDTLDRTPGYLAMAGLLHRLFGDRAAEALRSPYALGDPDAVLALASRAGIGGAKVTTRSGTARFASIDDWVRTDVRGWTLADMIDDAQYETLLQAARAELTRFAGPDGAVAFDAPAHILTATKS